VQATRLPPGLQVSNIIPGIFIVFSLGMRLEFGNPGLPMLFGAYFSKM
jgi:hypothetical protein